jgi:hypothetical protein
VLYPQKTATPSRSILLRRRGLRFLWLRMISTERPTSRSKNSLASISKKGLGVSVSTNTSTSLLSWTASNHMSSTKPALSQMIQEKLVWEFLMKHNVITSFFF